MNKQRWAFTLALTLTIAVLAVTGAVTGIGVTSSGFANIAAPVFNPINFLSSNEEERMDGGYYALVDEQGNVLDETALRVYKDDEFINADNRRYRVTKVINDIAQCQFMGIETLALDEPVLPQDGEVAVPVVAAKPVVGIYHSHGDESYMPSQGYSSAPAGQKGGVAEVATTLKSVLESKGITTIYNDATHYPHDSGAYHRSRRTAAALMKQGAQFLIDVHRDAVPAKVYRAQVNGQDVSQVKLVVGRRNPNSSASLDYAKKVKGVLDKTTPGLAKGIFIGKGVYNQDLRATNLLVEVGSDKITLDEAKKGVTMFAQVLPDITGGGTANPQTGVKQVGTTADQGNWKAVGWLIGAVILGGLGFLLISTGSMKGAANKLKHFGSSEWTNFLGKRRTKEIVREEEVSGTVPGMHQDSLLERVADNGKRIVIKETTSETTAEPLIKTGPNTEFKTEREYLWEPSVELSLSEVEKNIETNLKNRDKNTDEDTDIMDKRG